MFRDFNDVLLVTDVDGTLLDDYHKVSHKNLKAIEAFQNDGGNFTIATGRGFSLSLPIANELSLKIPAVIFNGAAIYDFKNNQQLWHSLLPHCADSYIRTIKEVFPSCAIEVLINNNVYLPCTNEREDYHLKLGNVNPIRCSFNEIPQNDRLKVLIVDESEIIDKIISFSMNNCNENVHWVRSSPYYYEMLPKNVNKGTGVKKLIDIIGSKFIVAVGDFMNDIEMLKFADLAVAVGNAEAPVKEAADIIVSDNNNHAIYDIIEYICKNGGQNGQRIKKAVANYGN